jgi:hypothetical protein
MRRKESRVQMLRVVVVVVFLWRGKERELRRESRWRCWESLQRGGGGGKDMMARSPSVSPTCSPPTVSDCFSVAYQTRFG